MPTIVFSEKDTASINIGNKLIESYGFEREEERVWRKGDVKLVKIGELHIYSKMEFVDDFCVVVSRHRSKTGKPTLTVHTPGNWNGADYGGEERKLCVCNSSMQKLLLTSLARNAEEMGIWWPVTLEVDHHGPTLEKSVTYIEIGSSEQQWNDERAVEAVCESVVESIGKEDKFETVFGVGGNHYAPNFTKVELNSEIAVGHMLPKYHVDSVVLDVFRQGIERCTEKVSRVLLDWKGMNAQQRKKVIGLCENIGAEWEKKK